MQQCGNMRPVGIQIASDNIFFPFSIMGHFIWAIISALFQLIAFLLVKITIIIWFFIAFLHSAVESKVYQQYRNTHIKRIKYKQSVSYTHYTHSKYFTNHHIYLKIANTHFHISVSFHDQVHSRCIFGIEFTFLH